MSDHTVTAKGQITLRKKNLAHLGVAPGERVSIHELSNGRLEIRPAPKGDISAVYGMLKRPGRKPLSIRQMNQIIADGWAGRIK